MCSDLHVSLFLHFPGVQTSQPAAGHFRTLCWLRSITIYRMNSVQGCSDEGVRACVRTCHPKKARFAIRKTIIFSSMWKTVLDLWLLSDSITNVRWLVICHCYDCMVYCKIRFFSGDFSREIIFANFARTSKSRKLIPAKNWSRELVKTSHNLIKTFCAFRQ